MKKIIKSNGPNSSKDTLFFSFSFGNEEEVKEYEIYEAGGKLFLHTTDELLVLKVDGKVISGEFDYMVEID